LLPGIDTTKKTETRPNFSEKNRSIDSSVFAKNVEGETAELQKDLLVIWDIRKGNLIS